jgi:hypothetical protein
MDLGFWGRNECEWMRIILRELLSLWMDDITHYSLNECQIMMLGICHHGRKLNGPAPPSKQYILSKTKQVKYFYFSHLLFQCNFNKTLFTNWGFNWKNLQHNTTQTSWLAPLTLRCAHITTNAFSWSKKYSGINIHSQQWTIHIEQFMELKTTNIW